MAVGGVLAALVLCLVTAVAPAAAVSESTGEQVYAYTSTGNPDGPEVSEAAASARASAAQAEYQQAVTDSVVRLYLAVFDRGPDDEGLAYWVAEYHQGFSLRDIGAAFMASVEWSDRYGAVDNDSFVELLYQNVLQRSADAEGGEYWRTTLAGGVERGQVLLQFSESTEFVAQTGTADPLPPYPSVPADSGAGRRIVYANTAQRIWLIEADGSVYDSYLVSGRSDRPSTGTYSVYSKSEKAWAGHDGITMNHMVRFAHGRSLAIGFHSIPLYANGTPMQTLDELGTYQSAGCVRQDPIKAELLYAWADVGTTVVVLD